MNLSSLAGTSSHTTTLRALTLSILLCYLVYALHTPVGVYSSVVTLQLCGWALNLWHEVFLKFWNALEQRYRRLHSVMLATSLVCRVYWFECRVNTWRKSALILTRVWLMNLLDWLRGSYGRYRSRRRYGSRWLHLLVNRFGGPNQILQNCWASILSTKQHRWLILQQGGRTDRRWVLILHGPVDLHIKFGLNLFHKRKVAVWIRFIVSNFLLHLLNIIQVRFSRGVRSFIWLLLVNIKFFSQAVIVQSKLLLFFVFLKLDLRRGNVSIAVIVVVHRDIIASLLLGLGLGRLFDYSRHKHWRGEVMMLQVSEVFMSRFCLEPSSIHRVSTTNLVYKGVDVHFRIWCHWSHSSHLKQGVLLRCLVSLISFIFTPSRLIFKITGRDGHYRLPVIKMARGDLAELRVRAWVRHIVAITSVPWQSIRLGVVHLGSWCLFMHVGQIMQLARLQIRVR